MTDLALIGQYSENNFNGCNCGIMDQFASANGKKDNAIFLDTNTLKFEYAPIKLDDAKIIITNSKVKHSLVDSAYNDRRQECTDALAALKTKLDINSLGDLTPEEFEANKELITDPVQLKRAKHAVYENQRTIDAVAALKAGDITKSGALMNQSNISMRDDYEVSCEEIDILVDMAWKIPGLIGSQMCIRDRLKPCQRRDRPGHESGRPEGNACRRAEGRGHLYWCICSGRCHRRNGIFHE